MAVKRTVDSQAGKQLAFIWFKRAGCYFTPLKKLVCFHLLVCFSEIMVSTNYVEIDVLVDLTLTPTAATAIRKQSGTRVALLKAKKHAINYFLRATPTLKHYSDIVSDIPSGSTYGIRHSI